MSSTDFLILGGGIIGLKIARELKHRFADAEVRCWKKKLRVAFTQWSNSGVIHARFYYSANSLKAKLTRAGNQAMTAYCEAKKIPLNRCGKLVVAKDQEDLPQLDELLRRGQANGVPLESLRKRRPVSLSRASRHTSAPFFRRRRHRQIRNG